MTQNSSSRAELLLAIYVEMGPEDRSLTGLCERLRNLGVTISLPTLKRYSAQHNWQQRALEADQEAAQRRQGTAVNQVATMLERHIQISRGLQGAAGSGLQRLLADPSRLANLKEADIVRLLDLGIRTERQALGLVSDRREVMASLANLLTTRVVQLFQDANAEPSPERRARIFAAGVDALVSEFLTSGGSQ